MQIINKHIICSIMQPLTPKESRNERERPLQKSMFLPEQHSGQSQINISRNQPLEFTAYNPMKRSSTAVMEGMSASINPPTLQYNNYSFHPTQLNSSFLGLSNTHNDHRANSQQDLILHHHSTRNVPLQHFSTNKTELKNQEKSYRAEKGSAVGQGAQGIYENHSQIIQEIMVEIKEKHLPQAIGKANKDLYDDLYHLRVELQSIREQFKGFCKKQEALNNDYESKFKNISISTFNFNQNNIHNISPKPKKENELSELQTHFFLLDAKMTQIEGKFFEQSCKFGSELERMNQKLESELKQNSWKVGPIRSSLSSILLEYKESFTVRRKHNQNEELVLSSCNYYIDKQGNLLDQENRYIMDVKGNQIKLDEKHLKLLEVHKILQKIT